jgi:hypothetical protein
MGDVARLTGDGALAAQLYDESLHRLGELGDQRCVASILFNLGTLALDRADPRAAALLGRSLDLRRRLNDQAGIAECLEAFASVEEGRGDPASAVRLLGAAEDLRERTGAARPASEEDSQAVRVRALRETVGADAFAAAWAAGRREGSDAVAAGLVPPPAGRP